MACRKISDRLQGSKEDTDLRMVTSCDCMLVWKGEVWNANCAHWKAKGRADESGVEPQLQLQCWSLLIPHITAFYSRLTTGLELSCHFQRLLERVIRCASWFSCIVLYCTVHKLNFVSEQTKTKLRRLFPETDNVPDKYPVGCGSSHNPLGYLF